MQPATHLFPVPGIKVFSCIALFELILGRDQRFRMAWSLLGGIINLLEAVVPDIVVGKVVAELRTGKQVTVYANMAELLALGEGDVTHFVHGQVGPLGAAVDVAERRVDAAGLYDLGNVVVVVPVHVGGLVHDIWA